MTAAWTSSDLAIRVEIAETCLLFSADHGTSWRPMSVEEARGLARGLCSATDRLEEQETESERSAA